MPGIVVGADGSRHSQHALEWAMREAGARHVPLTVVTVYQVNSGFWGVPTSDPLDDASGVHARARASEQADKAARQLGEARPPTVTIQSVHGVPAEELMRAADGADMLVVAARGTGGFARLHLGSVSTQLAHHAGCPIAIIPPDDPCQ
jgi:nucleotide-binding universal stress UspA family protein